MYNFCRRTQVALLLLVFMAVAGCETVKGVTADVANTARNIRDIFSAGKTIHDTVQK